MNLTLEQQAYLAVSYFEFRSDEIAEQLVTGYGSLLEHPSLIKNSRPSRKLLNKILGIVIDFVEQEKKFQKLPIIKIMRSQVHPSTLDDTTLDKLFLVYESLIFNSSEDVCWKLSAMLKDIALDDDKVNLLLNNAEDSVYILNRVLRYPSPKKQICEWAKQRLSSKAYLDRTAELIGQVLPFDLSFKHPDSKAMVWGIYYSKLEKADKRELLSKHKSETNFSEFLEVCKREGFYDIVEVLYKHYSLVKLQ